MSLKHGWYVDYMSVLCHPCACIRYYKIAKSKKNHWDWSKQVHHKCIIIHAAYIHACIHISTFACNLCQQWFYLLQNSRKKFSGSHYACNFNKNQSSHKFCCLKVVLLQQVDYYKRDKKTCSSCILELYKHLGIFKNTREVREALAFGSCFSALLSCS